MALLYYMFVGISICFFHSYPLFTGAFMVNVCSYSLWVHNICFKCIDFISLFIYLTYPLSLCLRSVCVQLWVIFLLVSIRGQAIYNIGKLRASPVHRNSRRTQLVDAVKAGHKPGSVCNPSKPGGGDAVRPSLPRFLPFTQNILRQPIPENF